MLSNEKHSMTSIQTLRNVMMPTTFMATTAAFLSQIIINILLDHDRMDRLNRHMAELRIPPIILLCACLGLLLIGDAGAGRTLMSSLTFFFFRATSR